MLYEKWNFFIIFILQYHLCCPNYLIFSHYQRMLDYLKPDFVHVLVKGRVVKEGTAQLGYDIEEKGFDWIVNSIEEA